MTAWHTHPMLAFDLETTSANPHDARIVTACAATVESGEEPVIRTWLANPGVDIPAEAAAIHGITTEIARENGQDPKQVLTELLDQLGLVVDRGLPIVAYNAAYDCTVAVAEAHRYGITWADELFAAARIIDPFVIDKAVDRYRKGKRTLTASCQEYRVRLDGAHDASFDALAAARLAWRFGRMAQMSVDDLTGIYAGRRSPGQLALAWRRLGAMTLDELHAAQVTWYAEQTESLAAFLRREREELRIRADETQSATAHEQLLDDIASLDARIDQMDGTWPVRTGNPT
jgi:DNA polymerase-3 subunit epsilon